MEKQTSINIDTIRLLLCLMVIISHILDLLKINNFFNTNFDFYCVWLFFVLSGYLNWHSINNKSEYFFQRRMKRLLPKYYFVLIASLVLWLVIGEVTEKHGLEFLLSFVMVQHLLAGTGPETNIALWSLSYEFLFYGLLSLYFSNRILGIGLIVITGLYGFLNGHVWLLGAGFLIGILLNKYQIEFDLIKLKKIKLAKYTYEIYIFHFPILFLAFYIFY